MAVNVHGDVRLGKAPHREDPRTLKLASYVSPAALPKVPSKVDYASAVGTWGMYGNDFLSDCTCAAAGNMTRAWTAASGAIRVPPDQDVLDMYWATGQQDDGRFELDVLNRWRRDGLGGDRIEAFAFVDPARHDLMRAATWLLGGLYVGLALPLSARSQGDLWRPTAGADTKPGSWGGHAVPIVGYSRYRAYCVTWGKLMPMTWGFLKRYCDEAWAVVSRDFLDAQGRTPAGFDLQALLSDLPSL